MVNNSLCFTKTPGLFPLVYRLTSRAAVFADPTQQEFPTYRYSGIELLKSDSHPTTTQIHKWLFHDF
jgi:hypothetical protein